ncbi:ABC-2 family transporter protein [Allobranchiibius sp. GilTou73]|uniref:ABC transporter permease n=1 Tax=Allobranchiibius sp. GilTou73 TaxID=2904523 RepID=UPI001F298A74|nr:ABC-2 family transporter protein [Allobranchiibius sp. GilTou73]UIJ35019.1 ABC-2 family transporter protein [Allobranchiibius sp. GilTou73]
MPVALAPYGRLFAAGIRQQTTYRLAMLGGLVANTTFGLLKSVILLAAVRAGGGNLHGYAVGTMATYVWLSQGLLGSLNLTGRTDLADRIKSGAVVTDFLRPISLQWGTVATDVGKAVCALLPRGAPSMLIGYLFVGMTIPHRPLPWVLGAVSLLLGITVSWASVYLVASAAYWLVEIRGLQVFYMMVSGFFAGLLVPISLFPHWLLVLASSTPFPSMLQYPIDVFTGRGGVGLITAQVGWLALVGTVGHVLTNAGRRRLEVQGG